MYLNPFFLPDWVLGKEAGLLSAAAAPHISTKLFSLFKEGAWLPSTGRGKGVELRSRWVDEGGGGGGSLAEGRKGVTAHACHV